ncbi:MAG: hypothetical protein KME19_19740 [Microcoleus vaginatus WJT46-NPBG5]|nr:hypothetical protein [Microcoleus vaginatus WJT46-NPBG5]
MPTAVGHSQVAGDAELYWLPWSAQMCEWPTSKRVAVCGAWASDTAIAAPLCHGFCPDWIDIDDR